MINEIEKTKPDSHIEVILKEHRRWTRWINGRRAIGEGALILTNRRLLFLYRIQSSPEVKENIKRLADAPMETVLNYALGLNRNNLQIPLTSIIRVGIGSFVRFPLPHFFLFVVYNEGKKKVVRRVAFQFRRYVLQTILHPQITTDWGWVKAIRQAMKDGNRPGKR